MNLLLLPRDLPVGGRVRLDEARSRHIRDVIGTGLGGQLRAGIERGPSGTATVVGDDGGRMTVEFDSQGPPPTRPRVDLVLALPRPKVLARVLEHAACFGVDRMTVVNAWRVDKAYFDSPKTQPEAMQAACRLGCEQGRHTWTPTIAVHRRFMDWIDSDVDGDVCRVVAQPGATHWLRDVPQLGGSRIEVAIGPEGGWIERELDTLTDRGHQPIVLSRAVLRTEVAVSAALAQIELLSS